MGNILYTWGVGGVALIASIVSLYMMYNSSKKIDRLNREIFNITRNNRGIFNEGE